MNQIPQSWATSLIGAVLRVIVLAFWVGIALLFVHLMGWADEGSRNLPVTTPAGVNGSLAGLKE
jgi:hypothetical protein